MGTSHSFALAPPRELTLHRGDGRGSRRRILWCYGLLAAAAVALVLNAAFPPWIARVERTPVAGWMTFDSVELGRHFILLPPYAPGTHAVRIDGAALFAATGVILIVLSAALLMTQPIGSRRPVSSVLRRLRLPRKG